jgi:hypothetical protein
MQSHLQVESSNPPTSQGNSVHHCWESFSFICNLIISSDVTE